jgi:hypothetical protein
MKPMLRYRRGRWYCGRERASLDAFFLWAACGDDPQEAYDLWHWWSRA